MRLLVGLFILVGAAGRAHAQPETPAPSVTALADGADVIVRFSAMVARDPQDWIGIARAGSPATEYETYEYTGGRGEGTVTFRGVPSGRWVARAFYGSNTYEVVAESRVFRIVDRCAGTRPVLRVTTDGPTAMVRFDGLCGDPDEWWIGISAVGSAATEYQTYQYPQSHQGTLTFDGIGAGRWVARAFFGSDSYEIRAQSRPFALADPSADLCRGSDPVVRATVDGSSAFVRFSSVCGTATDWIAIAPVGAPEQSYQAWRYTGGAREGLFEFAGLPPGRYEARVFFDWSGTSSYSVRAHSTPFDVAEPQRNAMPARK